LLAAELHRRHDVPDAAAARDRRRALVDHAVVDAARLLVARLTRAEEHAREPVGVDHAWSQSGSIPAFVSR
jgi:hypothetical protein